jgi:hypothetical protein
MARRRSRLPLARKPARPAVALYLMKRNWQRRHAAAAPVPFEHFLLANYAANLKAFYPLSFDAKDQSASANHGYSYLDLTFTGPTPRGFNYPIAAKFDGTAAQVRLENTTYPLGCARFTISCWFKKTAAGVTATTADGADGFPTGDPIVPLVTKGRGEADGSNVDCSWFLGLNTVSNGSTYKLAADFEDTATGGNHRIVGTTSIFQDKAWWVPGKKAQILHCLVQWTLSAYQLDRRCEFNLSGQHENRANPHPCQNHHQTCASALFAADRWASRIRVPAGGQSREERRPHRRVRLGQRQWLQSARQRRARWERATGALGHVHHQRGWNVQHQNGLCSALGV